MCPVGQRKTREAPGNTPAGTAPKETTTKTQTPETKNKDATLPEKKEEKTEEKTNPDAEAKTVEEKRFHVGRLSVVCLRLCDLFIKSVSNLCSLAAHGAWSADFSFGES